MTDYRPLSYTDAKIQVDSAIRDGNGVRIDTNYQRKPAVYERTTNASTSTTCTLIQFNASDYKANGYLAHFRFRVRSTLQDAYPSDNEFIVNYSYLTLSIICTNNKKTISNDIVQDIYAYYPVSTSYIDTGSYFIAFTTGRASTNFIIEMIEADIPYTIPTTISPSTTTNTTYKSLTPGNYASSSYPLMWTGTAIGNTSSANYSTWTYETRGKTFRVGEFDSYKLMAVDHTGVAYKINTSTKKFPLPISMYLGIGQSPNTTTGEVDTSKSLVSVSVLTDSSINGFTIPTLTANDGGKTLYVRGSLDADGYFVCDGNVTLSMEAGYTYIPFGTLDPRYSGSTAQVPTQISFNAISVSAYTLDANGRLTHVDGEEVRGSGSIQLQNQSVTFTANSDSYASSYPYRASVTQTGVTANTYASVVFSDTQSATGNYANFCRTDTDVIYLYARADVGTQTIPTISIGMDYTDITADNLPIRSDVSARTLTLISSSDSEYSGYPYKYSFTASGCVSTRTANVFFDVSEAISGDWASECETGAGIIYVWSRVAKTNPKLGYVIL